MTLHFNPLDSVGAYVACAGCAFVIYVAMSRRVADSPSEMAALVILSAVAAVVWIITAPALTIIGIVIALFFGLTKISPYLMAKPTPERTAAKTVADPYLQQAKAEVERIAPEDVHE